MYYLFLHLLEFPMSKIIVMCDVMMSQSVMVGSLNGIAQCCLSQLSVCKYTLWCLHSDKVYRQCTSQIGSVLLSNAQLCSLGTDYRLSPQNFVCGISVVH
jgi:hypothetical protein